MTGCGSNRQNITFTTFGTPSSAIITDTKKINVYRITIDCTIYDKYNKVDTYLFHFYYHVSSMAPALIINLYKG